MGMPKVISLFKQERFEDRFPGISILGEPTDLFVECASYDLQIPVIGAPKRSLDIFEEAILRMIRLKGSSTNDLSATLCLEKDLVWFILNCLKEKGLLNNSLALTDAGIRELDLQSAQKMEINQIQGRLFLLKKTGQILPYIFLGEFQSEKVDTATGKQIVLRYGNIGNPKPVPGLRLRNTDYTPSQENYLPQQKLQRAVLRYNRLLALENRPQIKLCQEHGIVSIKNDPVYFHIKAVVQDGNSDEILFSDGFVPNIDGMLKYVQLNYPDAINDIRKRAVQMTVLPDGSLPQKTSAVKKYGKIIYLYNNVCCRLPDKAYEDATPDERKKMDEDRRQIAINCYQILETVLFYYLREHPVPKEIMGTLMHQTTEQNKQTVVMMARNLGIRNTARVERMFAHLDGSRITSTFETETPRMHVCLPLAIVEAKESPDSRVRILIRKNANFLQFILHLHDTTASLRHDANASVEEQNMPAARLVEETSRIARTLLPNLQLAENDGSTSDANISQVRILAQASLAKAFGAMWFQMMSEGIKNEWMRISPDKTGRALPDMSEYAQILYRIFQTVLANANREFPCQKHVSRDEAIQRLTDSFGKALPKNIASVTEDFYKSASQGRNSSLGAEALVYAVNCEDLKTLIMADFVQTVDRILLLRGHGNQSANLTEDERSMGVLRDSVIELTKIIGG